MEKSWHSYLGALQPRTPLCAICSKAAVSKEPSRAVGSTGWDSRSLELG